jgi:hypothetical protein
MGRTRTGAFMATAMLIVTMFAAPPTHAARACTAPVPKLDYRADRISVALHVNYRGCSWWRSDFIDLEGRLDQGPVVGQSEMLFTGCGLAVELVVAVELVEARNGELKPKRSKPPVIRTCSIRLGYEHLPTEVGTYSGYFTYPWKNGKETIEFSYTCVSAVQEARCLEE